VIETIANLMTLVFVTGSMVSMGLSLTPAEITAPLANLRTVVLALAASFVVAPLAGWGIVLLTGLDGALATGLIVIAAAAGAPFLPKLVQAAKDDVATGVGLMVLLMAATVVILPLLLPWLLTGVVVDSWAIARSLILMMLLPLALALAARARYGAAVEPVQAVCAQAANVALIVLVGLLIVMNFRDMIGLVGSHGLIAALLFYVVVAAVGYLLGGPVMALATAQRNISAAVVVAGQNFGIDVLTFIVTASLIGMLVLFPLAGEFGRRRVRPNA
jgi:BASS family bile acid:Na+ symporter